MIKSEAEYEETLNMINELMESDPDPDSHQGRLLEKLCIMIREYEENEENEAGVHQLQGIHI